MYIFLFLMRSDRFYRLSYSAIRQGPRAAGRALALVLLCVLAGCAAHPPSNTSTPIPETPPTTEPRNPALALLDYAHHLATISPAARQAAVSTAREHVHTHASAAAYARLAIALGTPGQKLYTPDEAARYARLALKTSPSPWDTDARQYLADYARLYTRVTSQSDTNTASVTNKPTTAEILRLRAQLDEAHKKLRALAHIEERLDSPGEGG